MVLYSYTLCCEIDDGMETVGCDNNDNILIALATIS